ncbi:Alpha/Beta hydrolase protein [Syncephalis plumigaleata]|nr:Alpha/Beta hydrolase protein [Syncephalis plumigaleata]
MFAGFAAVATCSPIGWNCGPRCQGTTAGTQFVKELYHKETNTFAYVATNDKYQRIIVAFRGSVDISSWIQNLNFGKTKVDWLNNDDAEVHAGFVNCYHTIRSDLKSTIADVAKRFPKYTVTFTGHSLGGALAILAALDTNISTPSINQQVVTFGAPRIGNPTFGNMVSTRLYQAANSRTGGILPSPVRVVNYNDIVPRLPPSMFDYQHHDAEVWINSGEGDQATLCQVGKKEEDPNCAKSVMAFIDVTRHNTYFGILLGRSGPCSVPAPTYSGRDMDGIPLASRTAANKNTITTVPANV